LGWHQKPDNTQPGKTKAEIPEDKDQPHTPVTPKTSTWTSGKPDPIEAPLSDSQASAAHHTAHSKSNNAVDKAIASIEDAMKGKGKGKGGKKKFSDAAPAYDATKHGDDWWSGGNYSGSTKTHSPCYASHPPFKFTGKDGVTYTMFGGNGRNPTVKGCDIYIGFDSGAGNPNPGYPWDEGYVQPILVDYFIPDMNAPKNAATFKKLVDWSCNQLQSGKLIHAGCIGGHGRTGTYLAAVYAQMTGQKDAIQYVRKHYCHKAVETEEQIDFLIKHYGVSDAEANKKWATTTTGFYGGSGKMNGYQGSSGGGKPTPVAFKNAKRKIAPVQSPKCIW
jgi:hypothetical protein